MFNQSQEQEILCRCNRPLSPLKPHCIQCGSGYCYAITVYDLFPQCKGLNQRLQRLNGLTRPGFRCRKCSRVFTLNEMLGITNKFTDAHVLISFWNTENCKAPFKPITQIVLRKLAQQAKQVRKFQAESERVQRTSEVAHGSQICCLCGFDLESEQHENICVKEPQQNIDPPEALANAILSGKAICSAKNRAVKNFHEETEKLVKLRELFKDKE